MKICIGMYLEAVDKLKSICVDREITVGHVGHCCDWNECESDRNHTVAKEPILVSAIE